MDGRQERLELVVDDLAVFILQILCILFGPAQQRCFIESNDSVHAIANVDILVEE